MTTETTDPWEQAVFEAAYQVVDALLARERDPVNTSLRTDRIEKARERLRLHVQLFGLRKQRGALEWTEEMLSGNVLETVRDAIRNFDKEIAALEARLQEQE